MVAIDGDDADGADASDVAPDEDPVTDETSADEAEEKAEA